MSEKSLPRTTPKWLRDLKQGRSEDKQPASDTKVGTVGTSGSGTGGQLNAGLCERLARALPTLHRRAIGLSGNPAEAAELIQISCLQVLTTGPAEGRNGAQAPGADAPFDGMLHAAWDQLSGAGRDKGAAPRFGEVQKMAAQAVEGATARRPRLVQISRALSRLDPDQRRGLARLAGLDAGDAASALPKVILLALLMPFLERSDQAALECDDVADVLTRCLAALRQELIVAGAEIEPLERDGAVLVFALVGGILPDLVAPGQDRRTGSLRPSAETSAGRSSPMPDSSDGPASAGPADLHHAPVIRPTRDERLSRAYAITTSLRAPPRLRWPRSYPPVRNHAH